MTVIKCENCKTTIVTARKAKDGEQLTCPFCGTDGRISHQCHRMDSLRTSIGHSKEKAY